MGSQLSFPGNKKWFGTCLVVVMALWHQDLPGKKTEICTFFYTVFHKNQQHFKFISIAF